MGQIIAVAVITVLAVISPGADFAMTVRNSCLYGRTAGLLCALGISLGVLVHVAYTMLGVGLLVSRTPTLFTVMKIVGAAYLVYIGYKTFVARTEVDIDLSADKGLSRAGALRVGFLTNALNPKTMLFVLSTYTQVVSTDTPVVQQAGYGAFMSVAHLVWFGLAALFFSTESLRARLLRRQAVLNRVIGTVLVGLGVTLALTPAVQS
ncbi:LysE family transporter [Streptomyces sp. MUM 203J]|uniref:LysE family translocator n=1 Tax=Streptomyces sp. MUM 203J TaxID=2791990 RepID=UPI001F03CEE4|nr:LysE family transporter [Streptomyces sp. MUM 203J]MCH0539779.1 LysE family transporter [Streptomyces sp. MUM 203J]